MSSLQNDLHAITTEYTHRIVAVVQRAIADAVSTSIRGNAAPKAAAHRPAPKAVAKAAKAAPAKAPAAAKPAKAGKRSKGAKRAPEEIAATTSALLAFVKSHSGQRIEQIAKAMKVTTKDLALPAKKLLGDRKLKTKGQKRATQYFATLSPPGIAIRGGKGLSGSHVPPLHGDAAQIPVILTPALVFFALLM